MHELSLAQNLLDIVCRAAEENGLQRITVVSVVGGELGGIVLDALQFGFEVTKKGTVAEGAKLLYRELPALIRCNFCNHEFSWKAYGYTCPRCSHRGGEMFQGNEFYVEYIEGDGKEEGTNDTN
ncbi:MAG: hydrogenase maturation nickel metallochaperone HypA [Clostridia bacterium]|nr:hydrogenase maturation nickel metallochaperone HypA [Clostridia bacterium]